MTLSPRPEDQLFDGPHLVLVQGGDENPAALEGKSELFVKAVEHQRTPQFEARLQRADVVVKSAVHDPRIGLGRAQRHIDLFLKQSDIEFILREPAGDVRAADARPDYCNVKLIHTSLTAPSAPGPG